MRSDKRASKAKFWLGLALGALVGAVALWLLYGALVSEAADHASARFFDVVRFWFR